MNREMSPKLSNELNAHLYLKARLIEDFPDLDDETLADTLEGISDLSECLGAVIRSRADDEALVVALKQRMEDMRARLQRLQERADKKKNLLCDVMDRAMMPRLNLSDFTVTLRKTQRAIEILDEAEIPQDYWRPQPSKLDRQALGEALRAGSTIAGAQLCEARNTITVRAR